MKILVVGLNPSRKSLNNKSLKTLYKWLDYLEVRIVSFVNLYQDYKIEKSSKPQDIKIESIKYDKVLALGHTVSKHLTNVGVPHFKLPHPSGLNRKLNDKKFVHETLELCKNYLDE